MSSGFVFGYSSLEYETITLFRNARHHRPNDVVLQARTETSVISVLWKWYKWPGCSRTGSVSTVSVASNMSVLCHWEGKAKFCDRTSQKLVVMFIYIYIYIYCCGAATHHGSWPPHSRVDLYLTTLTTDKHPCPRWDSNPRSQQASGRRPTP